MSTVFNSFREIRIFFPDQYFSRKIVDEGLLKSRYEAHMSQESPLRQTERLGGTNPGITLPSLCGEPQGKSAAMKQIPKLWCLMIWYAAKIMLTLRQEENSIKL